MNLRQSSSVALLVLCQSTQSLAFGGIGLFLPLIRKDVGLSFTQAGSIVGAMTLVYALTQIPSGYLADRLGPKRLFVVGLIGVNGLAFVLAQLNTYPAIVANQVVAGVFRALVFAPGLLLMTSAFPVKRRATALGLYVAGGFSSNVLLNAIGPFLVGPIGWRGLFMCFSVLGLSLCLAYWRFGVAAPRPTGIPWNGFKEVATLLRRRSMWLVGGIQYVRLAVATTISFWLPTLIVEKGYSLQAAGAVIAVSALFTMVSNFLGGYIADRSGRPLIVIGTSLAVLGVTTVLIGAVTDWVVLVIVVIVNGFFVQFYFGPLFAVPINLFGRQGAGLASGFGNAMANLGGFSFAYALGAIRDSTGSFALGTYAISALCLFGVLFTVGLHFTSRREDVRRWPIEAAAEPGASL